MLEKRYWCSKSCVNGVPCELETDCINEKPNCCVFDGKMKVKWYEGKPDD